MTDYLACASTATGVPITECEVCGQRHPVTRAHCSRCRSWSAFQRSGLDMLHRHDALDVAVQVGLR